MLTVNALESDADDSPFMSHTNLQINVDIIKNRYFCIKPLSEKQTKHLALLLLHVNEGSSLLQKPCLHRKHWTKKHLKAFCSSYWSMKYELNSTNYIETL